MSTELTCDSGGAESPRKPIKSTAVVKLSAVEAPASFERLRLNTDLNEPPSNWLSTRVGTNGTHFGFSNTSSGFNSFRIANMFPDCVGEVDVVSDAENIKKLLKIPYSKGPVSMMVHRVENTLLIDEFDIHKHLLMAAESDWKWLRKFFFEHVMNTLKSKTMYQKDYSRDALQQRSLVSKFLYHSLREAAKTEGLSETQPTKSSPEQETTPMHWSSLPEPPQQPDHPGSHEFARNVVWTFEDIQMLLGTDMPIFGGDTHPCISLRLRDMNKPINVLTGIDYWLDNLMCNVPEVVMCYHLDGLVQKYELVKTEDLPYLPGSKFSPKLIHDVAQNILSFLKSNATTAGHTYWLFKGKNDDVVKLYDLTSLCNNDPESSDENPFTVPVAMLLYRVARNMKRHDIKQHGCIKMLLENCISLLEKEKHPQIVTSAHYMLSDLFVPVEVNPSSPAFPEEDESESLEGDEEEEAAFDHLDETEGACEGVEVGSLCWRNSCTNVQGKIVPPPMTGSVIERSQNSLKHVADGLACLRQLDTRQIQREEEEPKMAHPFTAIPMPYATLTSVAVSPTKTDGQQTDSENQWQAQLLTLLYEKAMLVLAVMLQHSVATELYGAVLRQVQNLLVLNLGLQKLNRILGVKQGKEDEKSAKKSFLLGQAGDACCMIVQHWDKVENYRAAISLKDDLVDFILNQLQIDVGPADDDTVPVDFDLPNMEDVLRSALECYKQAVALNPAEDQVGSLYRRIGNIHNELGVLYMSQATAAVSAKSSQEGEFHSQVKRSLAELESGIVAFEKVADSGNLALLLTNTGRLMRLCSHALSPANRTPLQGQEKSYYLKALNYYQKALLALGKRTEANEQIWDSVNWELSTTCFNMAVILQDYPDNRSKRLDELEKEVAEHLQKSLQTCDLTTSGARQPMYQFRAASIHHRLASLYHKSLRNLTDDHKKKYTLQLCKINYEKSAEMLRNLEEVAEFLRVQLERVALAEFSAENSSGLNKKSFLLGAVDLILNSEDMLKLLTKQKEPSTEEEEEMKLTLLMEQRLQCILLTLAKQAGKFKGAGAKESHFKAMYAVTLHRADDKRNDLKSKASRLLSIIHKVAEMRKDA